MNMSHLRAAAAVALFPWLAACVSLTSARAPVAPPKAIAEALPEVALNSDVSLRPPAWRNRQPSRPDQRYRAHARARRPADARPRVAERATLAAIYAKQYGEALQSAQLWAALRPDDAEAHEALAAVLLELDRAPRRARTSKKFSRSKASVTTSTRPIRELPQR